MERRVSRVDFANLANLVDDGEVEYGMDARPHVDLKHQLFGGQAPTFGAHVAFGYRLGCRLPVLSKVPGT